jgi:hypothetical protein
MLSPPELIPQSAQHQSVGSPQITQGSMIGSSFISQHPTAPARV